MVDRSYTELYVQIANTESILRFLLAGSEAFLVPSFACLARGKKVMLYNNGNYTSPDRDETAVE